MTAFKSFLTTSLSSFQKNTGKLKSIHYFLKQGHKKVLYCKLLLLYQGNLFVAVLVFNAKSINMRKKHFGVSQTTVNPI